MKIAIQFKKRPKDDRKLFGQEFREEEYGEEIQLWENTREQRKSFTPQHLYVWVFTAVQ